jgi:lysozyme
MKISKKGLDFIKKEEGFKDVPYIDGKKGWSIGYGIYHKGTPPEGLRITQEQAEIDLINYLDIMTFEISRVLKVDLNQNQFDAICSLVFNIGLGSFDISTILTCLNARDFESASNEFVRWRYTDGNLNEDLLERRKRERAVFLSFTGP